MSGVYTDVICQAKRDESAKMKVDLEKYISEIFATLQMTIPFEVFDCKNDVMPEWTNQVSLTYEFLICCKQLPNKEKLSRFISKAIFQHEDNFYWFEGDQISEKLSKDFETSKIEDNSIETKPNYLKTSTSIPSWLDYFIFNHLGAEYAPDFQRFEYNLNLTVEESKKYLGTYFPRSYAESFCIFDNIFQNKDYQRNVLHKDILNILSVGCGTGGDLMGLLTILEKYCNSNITINIWAVDGNNNSLDILSKIVEEFKTITSKKINLNILQFIVFTESGKDIEQDEINKQQYDFIISFKMINEVISARKGVIDNSYFKFVKTFVPFLSDNGLCVLLDVTTKQEHNNTYNPILMNSQVNKALQELEKYQTLLPLPCNLYENNCNVNCFTQQQFVVSHSKRANDISKVAYRIITTTTFAEQLGNPNANAKYLIGKDRTCCFTNENEKKADSYLLENSKCDFLETEKPVEQQLITKQEVSEHTEIFKTESEQKPILAGLKIVGTIDLSKFEKKKKSYIIDTNIFLDCPDVIQKISKNDSIILSAKVIDELDSLKIKLPDKLEEINKAFRVINQNMESREITMESADLKLLPYDFNKKSPDNFILAVALKHRDNNSVLLTSDNGLQVKAKGMKIKTLSLREFNKLTKK